MFNKPVFNVNIGLGDNIDPDKRDGVAWVKSVDGGIAKKDFILDKPDTLQHSNADVIRSMFEQVKKMGMIPIYLEVFYENTRKLYRYGFNDFPMYIDII